MLLFRRTGAAASVVSPHQVPRRPSFASLCSRRSSTSHLTASLLLHPARQGRAFFFSSSAISATTSNSSSSMDPDVRAAIDRLHAQKSHKVVVYATGGAAQALSWLLTIPGASNTVLEARVPYGGARSWADALGTDSSNLPSSLASAPAAAALAAAAYRQAAQLSSFSSPSEILGIGCTCALATGRERAGSDRVFVAAHGSKGAFSSSVELPRSEETATSASSSSDSKLPRREAQDALASRLLLRTLGSAVGCEELASLRLNEGPGENQLRVKEQFDERQDPITALLSGRASCVELGAGLPAVVDAPRGSGRVYLSGSFNPLHAGHEGLLEAAVSAAAAAEEEEARERGGGGEAATSSSVPIEGAFELSVVNADKGSLTEEEVRRRVEQFSKSRVVLTRAPLFEQKASLFGPGASFVVGIDTALRLLDPKYYFGGSDAGLGLCMGRIAARGVKVFVAGRKVTKDDNGTFLTLSNSGALDSTPAAKAVASLGLFREIGEEKFRADVSSTELREKAAKEAREIAKVKKKDEK